MSLANLEKLIPDRREFKLTAERLTEWSWYERFIAQNPDLKLRWEKHKTYEKLKDDNVK